MRYICAAYNAVPPSDPWNADPEQEFHRGLAAMPRVGGLEVPLHPSGKIHLHDPDWLLNQFDARWDFILTLIPGTLQTVQKEPRFGLASHDDTGRRAALRLVEQARQTVITINTHAKRQAVRWVELHSAPRRGVAGVESSARALSDALGEIASWDWQGARIAIEHCDRFIPGQPPEKGFLSIEEELEAITKAGLKGKVGMVINWGRSAIEGRSAQTPLEHIRAAKAAGVLAGVTFSGASPQDPLYGEWRDQHLPFAPRVSGGLGCQGSLLTSQVATECLHAAEPNTLSFVGVKIQPLPAALSVTERLRLLEDTFSVLDGCLGVSGGKR